MQATALGKVLTVLAVASTVPSLGFSCKCGGSGSGCRAFESADIVFAGRAERTEPPLDENFTRRFGALFPSRELNEIDIQHDVTPDTFPKLKELYASLFSGLARAQIHAAKTAKDLEAAVEKAFDQGQRATFRIYRAYKGVPSETGGIEVWSSIGGCGFYFAPGESYLVFASTGEDGRYSTSICNGTRRLTDAGDHLPCHGGLLLPP